MIVIFVLLVQTSIIVIYLTRFYITLKVAYRYSFGRRYVDFIGVGNELFRGVFIFLMIFKTTSQRYQNKMLFKIKFT